MEAPVLFIVGPARSGIGSLAAAFATTLAMPQRDASADLARVAMVADAGRRQTRRFVELGLPSPPRLMTPGLAMALLEEMFAGPPHATGQVLRAVEWLPEAAVLPALQLVLPHLPQARVIILHRSGVDTVASRLRARPGMDFVQHCLSWTGAMEAVEALLTACPGQAIAVGLRDLVDTPTAALTRLTDFLGLDDAVRDRLKLALGRGGALNRTGLDPAAAGPGLADIAWSTPEKELFVALCGEAMQIAGHALDDPASRVRRAPLRLAELAGSGLLRAEGMAADWPLTAAEGTLRLTSTGDGRAIAVCHSIAPAGRQRLTGRLRGLPQNGPGFRLRLDVVGTLSRRLMFGQDFDLAAGQSAVLAQTLAPLPAMIDLVMSMVSGHEAGMGFDLSDVSLSVV